MTRALQTPRATIALPGPGTTALLKVIRLRCGSIPLVTFKQCKLDVLMPASCARLHGATAKRPSTEFLHTQCVRILLRCTVLGRPTSCSLTLFCLLIYVYVSVDLFLSSALARSSASRSPSEKNMCIRCIDQSAGSKACQLTAAPLSDSPILFRICHTLQYRDTV